ncbi:MAG: hypothetical protein ACXAEN_22790 [Candidatus Thorarchaeota archaeon]|jgi:hypothetical protein
MGKDVPVYSPQDIRTERTTGNQVVSNTPSLLFSIIICSDSNGAATATIYDGSSTAANQKIDVAVIDDDMRDLVFNPPMYFSRGIYVEHGSNITSIVIRYADVRE